MVLLKLEIRIFQLNNLKEYLINNSIKEMLKDILLSHKLVYKKNKRHSINNNFKINSYGGGIYKILQPFLNKEVGTVD